MRYLKYFESMKECYGGITKDFINDIFIEISDMGFDVVVFFDKTVINKKVKDGKFTFGTIPYIEVRITKRNKMFDINKLKNSEEFKEIIEVNKKRLSNFNWDISEIITRIITDSQTGSQNSVIKIFIHRSSDKKYY